MSIKNSARQELRVFSDASKEAIGAVAYLKIYDVNGSSKLGFVLGKSKVSPSHRHTIPRLELCAAVLATELSDFIMKHLTLSLKPVSFYTDSQVVLGYLNNETRRFYVYFGNRVDRVHKSSSKTQWSYVPTELNPADLATRPVRACDIQKCMWLKGPESFLVSKEESLNEQYDLIKPEIDNEIRQCINVLKTCTSQRLGTKRFEKFSSWARLVSAISKL